MTYDASGHVVAIETYSTFFQTAGGVGPGSPITAAQAARGFRSDFCELGYWNGSAGTKATDVVTVFTPAGDHVDSVLVGQYRFYTACESGTRRAFAGRRRRRRTGRSRGVAIGMTEAQVVELLGKPQSTLKLSLGGGQAGKFARYTRARLARARHL